MPNHVRNVLKFKKLRPDDIEFILNTIAIKAEDDSGYWIDFDRIIPEPKIESECPEEYIVNGESYVMEYEDRPWFNWYKWHLAFWGTKWNAYDCYSIIGKTYITFVFSTAWSIAQPVIEQLHLLGYDFYLRYADENYGSNCGIISYEYNGTTGHRELYYDNEHTMENPEQFARRVWDRF